MKYRLGQYIYGAAAIASGICVFAFHDVGNVQQIKTLGDAAARDVLIYLVAAIEIVGGAAVAWPRTARAGAAALAAMYAIFALAGLPFVIAHPLVYNGWGNCFEQLSLAAGAALLYAWSGSTASAPTTQLARVAYYTFGLCVMSFALEQLFYLSATASFVPKWIAPGQMFWAILTTAAFALASIALLTGVMARLASQLNTAMILGFGLLVWVPALFSAPHDFGNWSEGTETLLIAASAWIVTEYLSRRRPA